MILQRLEPALQPLQIKPINPVGGSQSASIVAKPVHALFPASNGLRPGPAASTWFLTTGCLSHITEDALSKGGVPFLLPTSEPHGAGLCMTNTITENFAMIAPLVLAFGNRRLSWFFHMYRFRSELQWPFQQFD